MCARPADILLLLRNPKRGVLAMASMFVLTPLFVVYGRDDDRNGCGQHGQTHSIVVWLVGRPFGVTTIFAPVATPARSVPSPFQIGRSRDA
jgi:hypothetical protein